MIDRFQGDPAIFISADGSKLLFKSGQPVMDQGVENEVKIRLFTRKGWWGNVLAENENEKIGSDFEDQLKEPVTSLSSLNNTRESVRNTLDPMRKSGKVSDIIIDVRNPSGVSTDVKILIKPPGSDEGDLVFGINSINWIFQKINPVEG